MVALPTKCRVPGGNGLLFRKAWSSGSSSRMESRERFVSSSLDSPFHMAAPNPRQITPRGVARNLFRYRRRMAFLFFGVMLLTLVAIALYPRSYTSESKLFIRVGRESVALDPTATTGQTIMLQKTQVDEVNSALQVLLSREVMQGAVERLGADRIVKDAKTSVAVDSSETASSTWSDSLSKATSWIAAQTARTMAVLRLSDPGTPEELAIRKLESGLKAFAPKDSTVITVTYSAASPQLAHDVVEAVTNVFLDEHLRVNHTEGSQAFFAEQAESLQKQLTAAQDALRDRKNDFGISTIESRRTVFAEQLKDIELQLLSTGRELAYSNAEIEDLTRAIDSLQPELVTNRVNGFANEGKDLMRAKLYELEIEESKLRARYSEGHPLLEQIQQQRKEAEALLKDMPNDRTQTTAALNPNQRQLELDLLQAKAKKEAQQARLAAAQKQRDDLTTQLKELNNDEVQIGDLERNVQILDGKYRMHVEKLEQARLNDALGRDGIQNVKVAQAATLVGKPTSPKKPLLLALGFVLALGAAFATPFLAEIFDETLRSPDEVESELGLPVLLSLPYQKHHKQNGNAVGERGRGAGAFAESTFRPLAHQLLSNNGNRNGNGYHFTRAVGVVGCETGAVAQQSGRGVGHSSGRMRYRLGPVDRRGRTITKCRRTIRIERLAWLAGCLGRNCRCTGLRPPSERRASFGNDFRKIARRFAPNSGLRQRKSAQRIETKVRVSSHRFAVDLSNRDAGSRRMAGRIAARRRSGSYTNSDCAAGQSAT